MGRFERPAAASARRWIRDDIDNPVRRNAVVDTDAMSVKPTNERTKTIRRMHEVCVRGSFSREALRSDRRVNTQPLVAQASDL
ncbi:hypothetical protein [Lysobacter capsici]|uniref:hypothetical protein n=1 Tax=Lysobacter capsici TaxID=435897 RepID=UPI00128FFC0C|nr:hypothetical protein [Lysobacter capsici]